MIDRNGDCLKEIILKYSKKWKLEQAFVNWIENSNIFCNTLVDRIVTGYPKDKIEDLEAEIGYHDQLIVEGELFHLWVIEAPGDVRHAFPADKNKLNVIFTDNMEPYRTRKVRILNGAHTSLVPVGYLYGIKKVRESIENEYVGNFLRETIFNEICPTLDLPENELNQFANDVLDRFKNPFIEHELMSISLNSISKFKTRVLPSILEFIERKNELPNNLLFSLASLIVFYRGHTNGQAIILKDEPYILDFFKEIWGREIAKNEMVKAVLSKEEFWGMDLTNIEGIVPVVTKYIETILNKGFKTALVNL